MKRFRIPAITLSFAVLVFFLTGSVGVAVETTSAAAEEASAKYTAAGQISAIRRALGLTVLKQDPTLDAAAQNHSAYMEDAGRISFEEVPGESGFTGGYPADRGSYSGYAKPLLMEYDNYRMVSYSDFIAWCMQDPYLRASLLNPHYSDIGFARSGYYYCMVLGGDGYKGSGMTAVYPYPGQEEVPAVELIDLTNVPEPIAQEGRQTIGTPVTVHFFADQAVDLHFENVRAEILNTKTEKPVDCILVTPEDPDSIWNTIILFPTHDYSAGVRYTVTVAFDVYDQDRYIQSVDEKWSFTSVGSDYLEGVKQGDMLRRMLEALKAPDWIIEEKAAALADPAAYASREEAIALTIDLLNECAAEIMENMTLDYSVTFEDINQCGEDSRDKVQLAYQMRLIEDQGRGILNPKALITRAELGTIVQRLSLRFTPRWPEPAEEEESSEKEERPDEEGG